MFKNYLWVTGGKSQYHPVYTLTSANTENDVWRSLDGARWEQMDAMVGDYYAQNVDVIQPGPLAPWSIPHIDS